MTVRDGEREELRLAPADLLRSAGVLEEGSAFIWTKMRFSPDNEASVITPAAFVAEEGGEEFSASAQRLRSAESPLPRPPTRSSRGYGRATRKSSARSLRG